MRGRGLAYVDGIYRASMTYFRHLEVRKRERDLSIDLAIKMGQNGLKYIKIFGLKSYLCDVIFNFASHTSQEKTQNNAKQDCTSFSMTS